MVDRVDLTDVGVGLKKYRRGQSSEGAMQPTRDDAYRWLHYHAGKDSHYTTDVDAAWINANPEPNVLAFVEFKTENEQISFPQAVFFEAVRKSVPVFIIQAQNDILSTKPANHRFNISRFVGLRNHRPHNPAVLESTKSNIPWGGSITDSDGLIDWEDAYRSDVLGANGQALAVLDGGELTDYRRGGSVIGGTHD